MTTWRDDLKRLFPPDDEYVMLNGVLALVCLVLSPVLVPIWLLGQLLRRITRDR